MGSSGSASRARSLQAFDHVDPALAYTRESWALLDTVCARLMRYRDRAAAAGYRLVPEVAAALPEGLARRQDVRRSRCGRGFRFSDGRPVRADAFAQAIHRTMAPGVDSPAYLYTQAIVGAEDVHAGRTPRAPGVVARGNTLIVRFTREVRDFAAWTTMPFFCAVPPTLPPSPEGVRAFPGAGPYAIREYRPNERVIVRRNRYYGGHREPPRRRLRRRPQRQLTATKCSTESKPAKPTGATRMPHAAFEPSRALIGKYGINNSRFWVTPGLTVAMLRLQLFAAAVQEQPGAAARGEPRARPVSASSRQSVSDGRPTSSCRRCVPGFTDRQIYPLDG